MRLRRGTTTKPFCRFWSRCRSPHPNLFCPHAPSPLDMFLPEDGEPGLLVIEPQRAYTESRSPFTCPDAAATLDRINETIALFSKKKWPVIYVRHQYKKDGSDLGRMADEAGDPAYSWFKEGTKQSGFAESLKRVRGAPDVVKNRYNAFEGTALKHELDERDVGHVVITGFMTHLACDATARQAHDMDYAVTFLPDATGCMDLSPELDQDQVRRLVGTLLAGVVDVTESRAFLEQVS